RLLATRGTYSALEAAGVQAESVFKVNEGRPNIVDLVKTGKIDLIINTPLGRESFYDEKSIRRAAIRYNIPCITTLAAAHAAARGIRALVEQKTEVAALQDLHKRKVAASGGAAEAGDEAMDFSGVRAALTTPFAADDSVAIAHLKQNIQRDNATGLPGYAVQRSSAEFALQSRMQYH